MKIPFSLSFSPSFTLSLSDIISGGTGLWLLITTFWEDNGIWDDTATWSE